MNKSLLLLAIILLFTSCQKEPIVYVDLKDDKVVQVQDAQNISTSVIQEEKVSKENVSTTSHSETIDMNKSLMDFYNEWKHVKYRFGGNSKRGIDCSAFTQRVFKEKFDVKIPRNTRTQVKVGKHVKKSDLELGDLVFFKTGKYDRHVGIYMGDDRFMHASIKGVKFTKLSKPFYVKAYWTSRRIIN